MLRGRSEGGVELLVVVTTAAERVLLEADTSRARRAEVIDKMAAAIILQSALDRLAIDPDRDQA